MVFRMYNCTNDAIKELPKETEKIEDACEEGKGCSEGNNCGHCDEFGGYCTCPNTIVPKVEPKFGSGIIGLKAFHPKQNKEKKIGLVSKINSDVPKAEKI